MSSAIGMKGYITLLVSLLFGGSVMLLIETPDAWMSGFAQMVSGQRLQLSALQGGFIAGSAEFSWQEENTSFSLGRWEWRLTPRWDGMITESFNAIQGPISGKTEIQISWDGMTLRDTHFIAQTKALKWDNPLWMMMQPSAQLDIETEKINFHDQTITGQATITCQHAFTPQVRLPDLGSWQVKILGEGPTGSLRLVTLKGPLHAEGDGIFSLQPPNLKLSGRLWSEARYARDIEPLIQPLGLQQIDGAIPWKIQL
jgi:hypothetical protein